MLHSKTFTHTLTHSQLADGKKPRAEAARHSRMWLGWLGWKENAETEEERSRVKYTQNLWTSKSEQSNSWSWYLNLTAEVSSWHKYKQDWPPWLLTFSFFYPRRSTVHVSRHLHTLLKGERNKVGSASVGRVLTLELIINDTHLSKCNCGGCQTCKIVRRSAEQRGSDLSLSFPHFLLFHLLLPPPRPFPPPSDSPHTRSCQTVSPKDSE